MPQTDQHYYRALRKDRLYAEQEQRAEDTVGYLYPDFEARTYEDRGRMRTRPADVDIVSGLVQPGKGSSLFGDPQFFDQAHWRDFPIPSGTDYPITIRIVRRGTTTTGRGDRQKSTPHYQIELCNPATVDAFKGALDTLARNAFAKRYRDARGRH